MCAPWLATLAGAMLTLALSIGTPAAAAPEPVKVRAGAHDGFGRLVFEWSAPVGVASERQGQRLTLRFARPFAADLSTVLDAIGDDLVGLEHDGGACEVVLRLAPEVTPTLDIDEGRIVIVDLHRASVASAPAGGPAAMAVADRETSVAVRTGVHDSFFRIVLDWSKPTEFVTTAEDRRLRIRFERAAWIYAARIAERGQSLIEAASASQGDGWSELRLSLRAGVRPELFKEGRLVVIDLHEEPRPTPDPRTLELLPSQAPRPSSVVPSASLARTASRAPGDQLAAPAAAPEPGLPRLALEIAAAEVSAELVLEFVWSRPTAAAFLVRAGYLWSIFAPPAAAGGVVLPSLSDSRKMGPDATNWLAMPTAAST